MEQITEIEAISAIYGWAKSNDVYALNPIPLAISKDRQDAFVCKAVIGREGTPVIASLFLVSKAIGKGLETIFLMSWPLLSLLNVFEKDNHFVLEIAGPGLEKYLDDLSLKVSIPELGLKPQKAEAVMLS